MVTMVWAGCTKADPATAIYKGVVIYDMCGHIVVQSIGPGYIGQPAWTDENNSDKPVYKHVFTVANPCQFGMHSYGDTIAFRIVAPQLQHCSRCQVALVMPDTAYPIQVID